MYKNLLKNYNATICAITMQASSNSVDFESLKEVTPDQYRGHKRGLKFNIQIYREFLKTFFLKKRLC